MLSLPYAVKEAGLVLGMLSLALGVMATYFSLYILCSCARRSGVTSYIGVARAAYGNRGAAMVTTLLFVFTIFVLIAYVILLRDIWTTLFEFALGTELTTTGSLFVLFAMLVAAFPACMASNLYALRHFCYISFVAAIFLIIALGYVKSSYLHSTHFVVQYDGNPHHMLLFRYQCVTYNMENPDDMRNRLVLVSNNWEDILSAFPLFTLAFMCQFNILSMHSELVNPTRERVKSVIGISMGVGSVIYALLCFFGYLCAYELTRDDILLNFKPSDKIMLLGRFGFGLSMLVSVPMLVLPTRSTAEALLADMHCHIQTVG